jgi:hypothetical protein
MSEDEPEDRVLGKRGRRRERERHGIASAPGGLDITVSHADMRLDSAAELIKPAVLYADTVTIYSPATSMLQSARSFSRITDPREQILAVMEVYEAAPGLAPAGGVELAALPAIRRQLRANERLVRMVDRTKHVSGPYVELKQMLSAMRSLFENDLMNKVREIEDERGASELLVAMDAGLVRVGKLTDTSAASDVASWVNSALGQASAVNPGDMIDVLWDRILDMLLEPSAFPLLDAISNDLIRALEKEQGGRDYSEQSLRHSAEVTAASLFMGFLPYFQRLSMDELLDLREKLQVPLVGFRAAMVELSGEFGVRSMDREFGAEVQDAWRGRVEPALAEIRASLHDHGVLKETASTVMTDPRRVILEGTGGVIAAAVSPTLHVGHLTALAGVTTGITADVLLRAAERVRAVRAGVRKQRFYFLHHLDEASRHLGR